MSDSSLMQVKFFHKIDNFSRLYGLNRDMFLTGISQNVFNVERLAMCLIQDMRELNDVRSLSFLTEKAKERVRDSLYKILVQTMNKKSHHTTLHAELMGRYAEKAMRNLGGSLEVQRLGYLIGVAHDVIQDKGPKNNEFESAVTLLDKLQDTIAYQSLFETQKMKVSRLIFQTICSFTTLDMNTLTVFGQKELTNQVDSEPSTLAGQSLLLSFGSQLAHNDLFSKIEFFGEPGNFCKLVMLNSARDERECKSAILMTQMYQMLVEFKNPVTREIDCAADPTEKKALLKQLVLIETAAFEELANLQLEIGSDKVRFPGFWREGMAPGIEMKRQLGLDQETSLRACLLDKLEDPSFLSAVSLAIFKMNELGNPSFQTLNDRFFS